MTAIYEVNFFILDEDPVALIKICIAPCHAFIIHEIINIFKL